MSGLFYPIIHGAAMLSTVSVHVKFEFSRHLLLLGHTVTFFAQNKHGSIVKYMLRYGVDAYNRVMPCSL